MITAVIIVALVLGLVWLSLYALGKVGLKDPCEMGPWEL